MTHLKPEKRLNKNGVLVTKHVRADGDNARSVSIPSPSSSPALTVRDTLKQHADAAIEKNTHGIPGLRKPFVLYTALERMSDDVANAYLDTITDRPDEGFDELLIGVLNNNTPKNLAAYTLEIAKLDTSPERFEEYDRGYRFREVAKQVMMGLNCYEGLDYSPPDNILDRTDPEVTKTLGLVRVTLNLFASTDAFGITGEQKHGVTAMKLDDISIAELVLERPEDADKISDAILERKTMDARVIRDMLDSVSQSLRDGIL